MLRDPKDAKGHREKDPSSPDKSMRKQMTNKENEFKREKALLLQKVEFMQSEIEEYRHKDNETRKLNESIISSYKHTDHAREQMLATSLQEITKKHKHEIQSMMTSHAKTVATLEGQIKCLKERIEQQEEVNQQAKVEVERSALLRAEEKERRNRDKLQEQLKDCKNKLVVTESKLRKADQLVKTYRQHLDKINFESERGDQVKNVSLQQSSMADIFDLRRQEDELMMSKLYKSKRECEQSQVFRRSQVLNQMDLRTNNKEKERRDDKREEKREDRREDRRDRRLSTREWMEGVHESTRKSKKYLEANRESIQNLTSRISRVVSSMQKMKKGGEKRNLEYFNERLERKLRLK